MSRQHEQFVRRAVAGQHNTRVVQRNDGGGAAFHKDPDLLLGLAAQFLLAAYGGQMVDGDGAIADQRDHKQARARIRQEGKQEAQKDFEVGRRDVETRSAGSSTVRPAPRPKRA